MTATAGLDGLTYAPILWSGRPLPLGVCGKRGFLTRSLRVITSGPSIRTGTAVPVANLLVGASGPRVAESCPLPAVRAT